MRTTRRAFPFVVPVVLALVVAFPAAAQRFNAENRDSLIAHRQEVERQLESIAVIDRKLMVPMRDGVRLATDVYRPKDATGRVPTIFVRTPYNFNYWDVRLGAPRDMSRIIAAVQRGYAYVEQNERGHFFSEGNWDILGPPLTDGYDMLSWISSQPWSNGKVGMVGCSSTAEYQMGVASTGNPALAAINPQGFGAGVGRVGGWYEQGNWYRGGAVQMLFIAWLYGEQNQVRPMFPKDATQEQLIRASKAFDLAQQLPRVDWSQALRHLPEKDIIEAVGGPHGIFADSMPVATGGAMIRRTPNDPAWYRGGLYNDDMPFNVPGLWFMSWYDVSIGPNLAMFNHARTTATSPEVRDEQYAVIAPTLHCSYKRATEHTMVGDLDVGDARLDYDSLTYGWFDHFLKGQDNGLLDTLPKVRYYTMGMNKWQTADTWPPAGARPVTYYLSSDGQAGPANDGVLAARAPRNDAPDNFSYDPMNPVPSYGGNVCCTGNAVRGGAFDQRDMEKRPDILVYSTEALKEGMEVSGPVTVTLYVSSDARDTDFTAKLIDVHPDGTAYNLDETIQRMRYRDGYAKQVWMEKGKVYKVVLGPMNTSNYFAPGHRIRIEVSSSNFPRFDRNMNTGGKNYDETEGVVAHNAVHHSRAYPSSATVTVVRH